jgi:hypothetical protein
LPDVIGEESRIGLFEIAISIINPDSDWLAKNAGGYDNIDVAIAINISCANVQSGHVRSPYLKETLSICLAQLDVNSINETLLTVETPISYNRVRHVIPIQIGQNTSRCEYTPWE